jgi:hypothetical protein
MRTFSVTLAQNLGTGKLGTTIDVTHARVDLGSWRFEADKELTKLTPGDMTVRLADVDGSIWTWIKTQTQNGSDLLPIWLTVDVDGARGFTGLARPDQITRDRDGEITLTAQDWSSQLASKYLGAQRPEDDLVPAANPWLRPSPVVTANRPATTSYTGFASNFTQLVPHTGMLDTVYFTEPANWMQVSDLLDAVLPLGIQSGLKILEIRHNTTAEDGGYSNACAVRVNKAIWPVQTGGVPFSNYTGTFTRRFSDVATQDYYQVASLGSYSPCYLLFLDTVEGIVPGDGQALLNTSKTQSFHVLQVDADNKAVVTREEVKDIAVGDRLFFTEESRSQLVFEDARAIIARAAAPFPVDFSRLTMPTLPVPVLVWLPLRPLAGDDLTSLRDMDPGLTSIRAFGSVGAWDGTPEAGWAKTGSITARVPWTNQRLTAPASLMPDDSTTKTPKAPRRNKAQSLRYRSAVDALTLEPTWDPEDAETVPAFLVHDYQAMRRILVKPGGISCEIEPWTGSAWGTTSTASWQGTAIKSACVFPGLSGSLLSLTASGLQLSTAFPGSITASCSVPAEAQDAVLQTTPWGAYLVGSKGYGRVSYSAGTLSLAWVQPMGELSTFYPGTFAGLDADSVVVLGRFETLDKDNADSGKTITETWLVRLKASPSTSDAKGAVLWTERVLEGAPRTCGAFRDPSQAERVIGHCGGRMFQVAKKLPEAYALERFKPTGMKAQELIEHVAQVMNAVVYPTPDGVLHVVSRNLSESPIDLTIPACQVTETRAWEHRYTYVRVAGTEGEMYRDVPAQGEAASTGGQVLEMEGHPLIWSLSGCEAMARNFFAWFSPVRRYQTRIWPWADPSTPAPWESLPPLATVRLNGEPTKWLVLGLDDKRTEGEAKAKLLEVF